MDRRILRLIIVALGVIAGGIVWLTVGQPVAAIRHPRSDASIPAKIDVPDPGSGSAEPARAAADLDPNARNATVAGDAPEPAIPFGRLSGRVVDEAGTGLTGVAVSLEETLARGPSREALVRAGMKFEVSTDQDGTFVFDRYPLDVRCAVIADGGPTRTQAIIEEVAPTDDLSAPPIVLFPACAWTIAVVDGDHNPIAGASIETSTADPALAKRLADLAAAHRGVVAGARTGFGALISGNHGEATFERVPRGAANVTVQVGDAPPTHVSVDLDESIERTEIVLGPESQPDLTVSVRTDCGAVLTDCFQIDDGEWPGLRNTIRTEFGAQTGAFALDVRIRVIDGAGTRDFQYDSTHFRTLHVPVSGLVLPVDVELWLRAKRIASRHFGERPGAVEFRITDADVLDYVRQQCGIVRFLVTGPDGEKAPRASAILHWLDGDDSTLPSRGFVFPGGNFANGERYVVPAGPGLVLVSAPGFGKRSVRFVAKPGQFVDFGAIQLSAGGTIDLEIVRPPGTTGTVRTEVSVFTIPGGDPVLLAPDVFHVGTHVEVQVPPGRQMLGSIAIGDYRVRVATGSGAPHEVTATVTAGASTAVRVELIP